MPAIFEALPGIEVPVGSVSKSLAQMWAGNAADGRPAPEADDAKATQVNFVLHLGLNTTQDDAAKQFATVVKFSQRYPSRIVVLCPLHTDVPGCEMRAKVWGECFLGKTKNDKRCVEFVMLSYSRAARPFLENEVSVCLSTDLPLYYWAHRFSASGRLADYRYLLSRAKRVMIDSAIAPADAFTFPWPKPTALRDLVYCRLLPVRQSIGQFLSSYAPAILVDGLRGVKVGHEEKLAAEGCDVAIITPRFTKPLDEATHEFFGKAADLVIKGLNGAIASKRVTYDFARLMDGAVEIKCSEFADNLIAHM